MAATPRTASTYLSFSGPSRTACLSPATLPPTSSRRDASIRLQSCSPRRRRPRGRAGRKKKTSGGKNRGRPEDLQKRLSRCLDHGDHEQSIIRKGRGARQVAQRYLGGRVRALEGRDAAGRTETSERDAAAARLGDLLPQGRVRRRAPGGAEDRSADLRDTTL